MDFLGVDVKELITNLGLWGVFGIIFAESSIIFFLPGDSLLFIAGLLASQQLYSVVYLIIGSLIAAVIGNNFGYGIGRRFGEGLFEKDKFLFKKEYSVKAHHFFEKYGALTIIMARFIPVIRTFAPIVAGIGKMNYRLFLIYNVVGALIWILLLSLAGYYLGEIVPNVDKYLLPIVAGIIILSVLPGIVAYLKNRKQS